MNMFRDYDDFKESFKKNPYLKTGLYIVGGIVCIWILGKASLLLTNATKNFKAFYNEFK